MRLAPFVQIVARGQGRARPLTLAEAQAAMACMLSGDADPEAVGALLMVLRLRGETPAEIAGFTAALRLHAHLPPADLDWPCYAAGRSRGAPLFLLAARLVANAGFSVALHGPRATRGLQTVLNTCDLLGRGLTYNALEDLSPAAFGLLRLRDTFGLRSCVNTVLRMWNPSCAPASVQGVFHPSYRGLQAQAASMLGQRHLTIIKGGGGEFERHPGKTLRLFGVRNGAHIQLDAPPLMSETRRLHEPGKGCDAVALWRGQTNDPFAQATVTGTAALALWTLGAVPDLPAAQARANQLWASRPLHERTSA